MPHRTHAFPVVGTALLLAAAAASWRARRDAAQDDDDPTRLQADRGRRADSPRRIPWLGWKDIILRTYEEVGEDRLLAVAAGVVFYGLLALFPTITAFVSLYGLFADVNTVAAHLDMLAAVAPADALGVVREQTERIATSAPRSLGLAFGVSLALAVWSANAGMKAMFDALNVAYGEKEKRGFFRLNLVSLTFTLAAILFLLVAIGGIVAIPIVLATVGLESSAAVLLNWLRWPALLVAIVFALSVLYRFGPSRERPRWQWISVGSVTAALLWLGGSALFSWYLSNFADYNATYGSLGAVIGLMMWFWLTAIVVLLGAELNAEIEHQTARDSTTGAPLPRGVRGAHMADTVGAARASA